jgi:hypothetical protein
MLNWLANEKTNKAIDTISKVVQVIAILIAGWWAYKTFFWSVKPGLDYRGSVDTALDWTRSNGDDCQGSLNVTIANDGMSTFDVSWMSVKGWLFTSEPQPGDSKQITIARPTSERPVLVDYDRIEKNPPYFTAEYLPGGLKSGLLGHYPPGSKFNESWDWNFKRNPGQAVLFEVEVRTSAQVSSKGSSSWVAHDTCSNLTDTPSLEKNRVVLNANGRKGQRK